MTDKQPITQLDRFTVFVGISIPLALTLCVSVYVAMLVSGDAFPGHEFTLGLIALAWVLIAALCISFARAIRRRRLALKAVGNSQ